MDLKLIRIPVGNSEEDKNNFIDKLLEIYPQNTPDKLEPVWDNYTKRSILQILLNVETSEIVATMSANYTGTFWQLTADFLNNIPHVDEFLKDPSTVYKVGGPNPNPKYVKPTTDFDIDDILDEIAEIGYDDLSQPKKDFLKEISNKK